VAIWFFYAVELFEVKTAIKRGRFAGVLSNQRLRFCAKSAR
jgi:hypothetical protein